ncbi:DUF2852 domain-containing protein [Ectothiorhodospiraceae bacterium WFHF3C12]|nr:DUF2852 domain-containing protein [Ectothiorhodospiraceae bacterium WFHF3C12]
MIHQWQFPSIPMPDPHGPATLAAMIVGFVVFWPIGLAILLWRLGKWPFRRPGKTARDHLRLHRRSGNMAFDAYKRETLERIEAEKRRLAEEQTAFEDFARDLQRARDQAELNQFLATRQAAAPPGGSPPDQRHNA